MRRHIVPLLLLLALGILQATPPRKIGEAGEGLRLASSSPDGKWCAGISYDKGWRYGVWELSSGAQKLKWQKLQDAPATFNPFAWSPDGTTLVVGAGDHITIWDRDFKRGRKIKVEWMVRDVRFSGDVLFVRMDSCTMLFEMPRARMFYRQGQPHLLAARLSRDARMLALASFQEPIVLFDVATKRVLRTLPAGTATINLEFCNDDRWLATGFRFRESRQSDMALVYECGTGARVGNAMSQPNIMGFAVAQDGTRLLARGPEQTRVWDVASNKLLGERKVASQLMDAFSPDGKLAATVPVDGNEVILWKPEEEISRLQTPGPPRATAFPGSGIFSVLQSEKLSLYRL